MLLLHIILALTSVVFSTYIFFSPSKSKLNASYALVALTVVTGTYLVVSTHAQMLQACMTGLLYVGAMVLVLAGARHKLATQRSHDSE